MSEEQHGSEENGGIRIDVYKRQVTACKDEAANVWRLRLQLVTCGSKISLKTDSYRDALANPPVSEACLLYTSMSREGMNRMLKRKTSGTAKDGR